MNGADSLVKTLIDSGVEVCFSNPGTSEMHFVAALDRTPEMRCVLALFEGVATGAADGYFRMARKPASTLLHLGAGLGNGIANLHNAKKAGSGVVNIVGEHAIYHLELDAPLTSDVAGLARPVSNWVRTSESAADVGRDGAEAVAVARQAPGQIATLILPGNTAWEEGGAVAEPIDVAAPMPLNEETLEKAARALSGPDSLIILGGEALTEEGQELAARISAKTGCQIVAEGANARWQRGAGRTNLNRLPYPIQMALDALAPFKRIVLIGSKAPVAFFAYPGKPGILTAVGTDIIDLAPPEADPVAALDALAQTVGASNQVHERRASLELPGAPTGKATPDVIGAVLARTIPENAIVCDESVSSGGGFITATMGAKPHDWLVYRGGSIGECLPMAVGAALACPDRKVLAISGDGSAMMTPQALWSMARENLDVTVIILSNRSYNILFGEFENVGVQSPGPRAIDMMTLDRPDLNFVDMARGMGVEGRTATNAEELERAILAGLAVEGPFLIDLIM